MTACRPLLFAAVIISCSMHAASVIPTRLLVVVIHSAGHPRVIRGTEMCVIDQSRNEFLRRLVAKVKKTTSRIYGSGNDVTGRIYHERLRHLNLWTLDRSNKQDLLEVHGRARREAARRRNTEWTVN